MPAKSSVQKRLAIILPHLGVGGAQRVAVNLANHWCNQKLSVHVVTILENKEDFYDLSQNISRSVLKNPKQPPRSLLYLKERLKSFNTNALDPGFRRDLYYGKQIVASRNLRLIASASIAAPILFMRRVRAFSSVCVSNVIRYSSTNATFGRRPHLYAFLLGQSFWRVPALRRLLRKIQPDVVVSFLGATNIITIAAATGLPTRVVISERNDPTKQELDEPWQKLRPLVYPMADIITANSHGALEHMSGYCQESKLAYVPNPVVIPNDVNRQRSKAILFLARLVHQKGPDILIDAFARFSQANPEWSLQIAGDGPMDRELMQRVQHHGIADRVVFHGMVKDPSELLTTSEVFVLPSRFEGTPNALLEAMAAKLACIVTDASPGPLKLIQHGLSGLVVKAEDAASLAGALHQLASDRALRGRLGEEAWSRTSDHRIENVAAEWEGILFP